MIIFKRGLFDWLLPIWALPSVSEMRDKMQIFSQGINTQLGKVQAMIDGSPEDVVLICYLGSNGIEIGPDLW